MPIFKLHRKSLFILITSLVLSFTSCISNATIVQFETNFGNFEVNLYDQNTPATVANFLKYVTDGDYSNNVFHRAEPGFVLQGGGFAYNGSWPVEAIAADPAVTNEPVYSNVRGTIAMAKLGSNANSATNQWFFNLANNSANLDRQNGGFTVFGEVTGDGMAIIDQIMTLQRYNFGSPFASIPLQNYDIANDPDDTNLVIITSIQVIDANANTAAGLNPALNIGPEAQTSSGSGGGSLTSLVGLLLFLGLFLKLFPAYAPRRH